MKKKFIAVVALATSVGFSVPSQAATLTGDTIDLGQTGFSLVSGIVVGAGVDYTNGVIQYDFDAGALGNHLVISLGGPARTYSGMFNDFGTSTVTLSNLDFSGGAVLTGFNVLNSTFPITVNILTPTSFSLSWTEGNVTAPSIFLEGEYITSEQTAATPLPAALPLFAGGLGALGLLGWRRKRKRAA